MNTENKKEVLEVLNSLEVVEEGSEGYILVENSPEVHEKLNALGINSETINKYGDNETFCIIALAYTEDLATDFVEGHLVYNHTDSVLRDIGIERSEQDKKWGKQHHEAPIWLMIAQEEFGEVAQAIQRQVLGWGKSTDETDLYKEIVQTAAVLVAFAEQIKEQGKGEKSFCGKPLTFKPIPTGFKGKLQVHCKPSLADIVREEENTIHMMGTIPTVYYEYDDDRCLGYYGIVQDSNG